MFKKRAAPNKSVNLSEQITQIQFKEVEAKVQPTVLSHIDRNQGQRIQSACTNSLFPEQQPKPTPQPTETYLQTLKQQNLLQQTPAKFRQSSKPTIPQQEPQSHRHPNMMIIQEDSQEQSHSAPQPPPPNPNKIITIEEDENNLEVIEDVMGDAGQIESEEEAYADEIIRKALTKDNYNRVKVNKKQKSVSQESKEKTLLKKIDISSVVGNIVKEQAVKERNLEAIDESIARYQTELKHRKNELADSKIKLQNAKEKFEEIKSILQFLYDRGDEVRQFTTAAILDQMYS